MDELYSAFGNLWGFLIFVWVIRYIYRWFTNPFTKNFRSTLPHPSETIRPKKVSLGLLNRFNGVGKIAEQNEGIFLKLPLTPAWHIPFNSTQTITSKDSLFGGLDVTLKFSDRSIPNLRFSLRKKELSNFPKLLALAKHGSDSVPYKVEAVSLIKNNPHVEQTLRPLDPIMNENYEPKNDGWRKLVLIAIVLFVAIGFFAKQSIS